MAKIANPLDFLANARGNTWFHRIDPRVKMIYLFGFVITDLIFADARYLLVIFLTTIPIWVSAKINLRPLLGPIIAMTLSLLGLMIFVFSGSAIYATSDRIAPEDKEIQLGPVTIYPPALNVGAMQIMRMAIPMATTLLVFATTDPSDFARAINRWKAPREVSFLLVVGLRLFPLTLHEFTLIQQAQKVRGVSTRGPVNRLRAIMRTNFPLLVILLRKSRDMGIAVESRGFGARKWEGALKIWKMERNDYLLLIYIAIFLLVALYVRIILGLGWLPLMM